MNNIEIKTIPHNGQLYPTVGNWFFKREVITRFDVAKNSYVSNVEDVLHIEVSQLSDPRRELLIAIHELVEVALCQHAGITQEMVDEFDKKFEANRPENFFDEPGDDPNAPYHRQHCLATGIERILAAALEVTWKDYENELESLP